MIHCFNQSFGAFKILNFGFADGIVNSALRFRAQAPIVDQLLKEIGLEGGDIQRLVSGVSSANAGVSDTPAIKE